LKTLKNYHFAIILILSFFAILLNSCDEEPDLIGLDLQPQSEKLGVAFSDTSTVFAYSLIDDSLRTDNYSLNLLGTYNDPIFGTTSASIFTQIRLSNNNVDFGNNPVLDSVILKLPYSGSYTYNDITTKLDKQHIKIYEVSEKIYIDSVYYSDKVLNYDDVNELGDLVFTPAPKDSVSINGVKYPPLLQIKLNSYFGNKLLNAGTANLIDNDKFTDYFKGLFIKALPLSTTQTNKGAILYFNLNSTLADLTIYYKNSGDTTQKKYIFVINDKCSKFTNFNHYGYSNASLDLKKQLGIGMPADTTEGFKQLYLQSMGGVKINLKLPYLRNWVKDRKVVINEAVLVLSNIDVNDNNTPPKLLTLLRKLSSGKTAFLPDYIDEGSSFFDANYNSSKREYRIRITRYIQYMLNTTDTDYGLVMLIDSRRTTANRLIIRGTDKTFSDRLKLEIKYTLIK
jgi:hypothetical protein